MLRGLLIPTLALSGIGLAGALAQEPPAPDLEQITYDVEHLPLINALDLTREQVNDLIPVLEAAAAERERMSQEPPAQAIEAMTRLREALLRGEAPEDEAGAIPAGPGAPAADGRGPKWDRRDKRPAAAMAAEAIRRHLIMVPGKGRPSPELARLANRLGQILTDDQITTLLDGRAADKRAPAADRGPAVGAALTLLRRLSPAAYTARREALADEVAARTRKPGTFEYEAARTEVIADLDRVRALSDEDFDRQRDQLAADFSERWGALAVGGDGRPRKGNPKARATRVEDAVEKLYACDDQQYQERRGEVVDNAIKQRLALDPGADETQLRGEIVAALDAMRGLTPLEFQDRKAQIAESVFGGAEVVADPRALAALNRLADERMIALLKAKLQYL